MPFSHRELRVRMALTVVKGFPAELGMCSCTVTLNSYTNALSYHDNSVVLGSKSGDIIIINAITGSQAALLSGHTQGIAYFAFSSDGTSLVSRSYDKTVKLWDLQTGGVIKTFSGHTQIVFYVSISAEYTMIASGSNDNPIC